MKYRIEQIVDYTTQHYEKYSFTIREYSSSMGEYSNEAVVFNPLISDMVGIIIEEMPFNPVIYYKKDEMLSTLNRLEHKAKRIVKTLKNKTDLFNYYVRGEKKETKIQ